MADDNVLRAAELTTLLRSWITLRQEHGDQAPQIAGALIYELTALIARASQHPETAHAAIELFSQQMHLQIDQFGVNRMHP